MDIRFFNFLIEILFFLVLFCFLRVVIFFFKNWILLRSDFLNFCCLIFLFFFFELDFWIFVGGSFFGVLIIVVLFIVIDCNGINDCNIIVFFFLSFLVFDFGNFLKLFDFLLRGFSFDLLFLFSFCWVFKNFSNILILLIFDVIFFFKYSLIILL